MYENPSQAGKAAHRIIDWIVIHGSIWVTTRRHDWHLATGRELNILNRVQ